MTHTNGHHHVHRFDDCSPEEIQRELDATRREMANTIHAIEHELSSRQLMMKAVDFLRGGPLRFSHNFTETAVNNPVPIALIGIGLMMLARSESQRSAWRDGAGVPSRQEGFRLTPDAGDTVREKTHQLKEKAHELKERAHEIGERAHDLRVLSSQRVRHSVDTMQRTWHENPMMVGLCALAAGAVLAAMLPTTRQEREVIGPRRDRLVDEVKRTAQSAIEGAKSGVESAMCDEERALKDEPLTADLRAEEDLAR